MKGMSFSAEMSRALWHGRKTVTRRLMKPQPDETHWKESAKTTPKEWRKQIQLTLAHYGYDEHAWCLFNVGDKVNAMPFTGRKPRYIQGEVVYVKESWRCDDMSVAQDAMSPRKGLFYRSTMPEWELSIMPNDWRSLVIMPQWVSRLHLRIVDVRPERIQDITEEEIIREGFSTILREHDACVHLRDQFMAIWNVLYPGSWDRNDWVWRYELEEVWRAK